MRTKLRNHVGCTATAFVAFLLLAWATGGWAGGAPLTQPCSPIPGWSALASPTPPSLGAQRSAIYAVAVDHEVASTIFVAGIYGLYRSDDCGQTWSNFDVPSDHGPGPKPSYAVGEVAIDSAGTLYAGSDYQRITATSDRGATWVFGVAPLSEDFALPIAFALSKYIIVSVSGPGVAYAILDSRDGGGRQGFWRSDDGGATWLRQNVDRRYLPLAVAPDHPDILYGSTSRPTRLGRSPDSGTTFEPLDVRFEPDLAADERVVDLELSVTGGAGWLLTSSGSIYQSHDGLQTWRRLAEQIPAGKVTDLALSHVDETILFAITDRGEAWLYRSPDAGK